MFDLGTPVYLSGNIISGTVDFFDVNTILQCQNIYFLNAEILLVFYVQKYFHCLLKNLMTEMIKVLLNLG